jgi:hypothetical protein
MNGYPLETLLHAAAWLGTTSAVLVLAAVFAAFAR